MLRQCNQTNVANAVCVKITRSNDQKIEAYKYCTTCQGCFPTLCTKRTIGWASILWTRSNSGVYDYRIPFCKTCKSKVTQRAQMYIEEYQYSFASPLHTYHESTGAFVS